MSVSRHHADWLSLVESSGPFLSLPVLMRVFPQGLDPRDPEQAKQLRLAYEEWQENPNLAGRQRAWIIYVLTQALGYPPELLTDGQALPPALSATMAEYGETLRPEIALLGPAGSETAEKPQMLISIYSAEQSLDKPVAGKHWKAAPATRMMELLHATDVPLGLVTNGEQWMLVFAPRGETTGFTSWYASLWIDEPITLRAFHSLLSARQFFGVAATDTLLALLEESAQDQQEVTNQLGDQVRDAVEVLIQAFDRLDQDSERIVLKGVDEKNLYDAALTVMMRLVFLFSAEERGLLHLGKPIYDDNYAVSTLREQLQEVADHYGEEVLERRNDAWARLLATFRAVHAGVSHQDLMLPAYGGSLFDPDRYPFLERRPQGSRWQSKPAEPLEINNRVVLHLLKSLQMLQVKVPGGGPAEARRISFRALDIEQIGHIYEGLLDHTAVRAKKVVLGLAASRKKPVASMPLADLEELRQQDEAKLVEVLEEETGRSVKTLEKALKNGGEPEDFHNILVACGQDQKLTERVVQFRGLLRQDSFERPVIVLPGGIYVGQGSARRNTSTHYTPRSLTEPIVQHTLEPLVYDGPAQGLPKEQWRLKSPNNILDLKVCDMAMGSGAFLVQACRYLSERLAESWENVEKEHPGEVLITPEGQFSRGKPSERLIPKEAPERLAIARRLVADRCLYGVDITPMAVEMAKLSIWLITVDKTRPFTFLDHALKCGDSLLGICRFKQLETFSLDDERAKQVIILSNYDELIRTAIANRRELEMLPSNDVGQIAAKEALLATAEERLERLKLAADFLISAELTEGKEQKKDMARAAAHIEVTQCIHKPLAEFRRVAHERLGNRRTLHWPLEFPEVFERAGFSAFIGNPPFVGGRRIRETLGDDYRNALYSMFPESSGNADLSAFFFLRAFRNLAIGGTLGLVSTNTVAQGDTRETGLDRIVAEGGTIYRSRNNMPWPGAAAVVVSVVNVARSMSLPPFFLDDTSVEFISSSLDSRKPIGRPKVLMANLRKSFQGSLLRGMGFVLSAEEADALLRADPRNEEVIQPFLNGDDLNSSYDQAASRWVINFSDWPLEVAQSYVGPMQVLLERVYPERMNDEEGRKTYGKMWWQFWRPRKDLYSSIGCLKRVLVVAATSKTLGFAFLPVKTVFSHATYVFAFDGGGHFAVIQSTVHDSWAREYAGSLKGDLRYTSDVFETFPLPFKTTVAEVIGESYYEFRRNLMQTRREGLTDTYNRFHNPDEKSTDIVRLRELHSEMDQAVAAAYDWTDVELGHGFHETKQGVRYTLSEAAQRTVLDRLLALNHQRYDEEINAGLHEKKANSARIQRVSSKNKMKDTAAQSGLY